MVVDMAIAKDEVRATGSEATVVEAKDTVTGVRVGVKDTQPTPPITKTVSDRSAATRPTMMEVVWSDQRGNRGVCGVYGK